MTAYENLEGLNWSSLKYLAPPTGSPLLYRYRTKHPEPRKDNFDLGSAFHCQTLEPQIFNKRFTVYEGTRNKRHKVYQEFLEDHPGETILKPSQMAAAKGMAAAIRAHPDAMKYLSGGRAEEPLQWVDPLTEVKMKGRLDYLQPSGLTDLKGTPDVSAHKVMKAVATYNYHAQAAVYHNGAIAKKRIPPDARPPVFVFCEWDPPHDVSVDEMSLIDLAAGEEAYSGLIRQLLACIDLDSWPGKAPSARPLQLPGYALGMREDTF